MQQVVVGVLLVCGFMTFGAFSLAVRLHFKSSKMPTGMKLISLVSVVGFALFTYFSLSDIRPMVMSAISTAIILSSAALFTWSIVTTRDHHFKLAFDPATPNGICSTGPFRYVRHPFYLSYIVFWAGAYVGTLSLAVLVVAIILINLYTYAALAEEAAFSQSDLNGQYAIYRQRTGFIIPRLVSM